MSGKAAHLYDRDNGRYDQNFASDISMSLMLSGRDAVAVPNISQILEEFRNIIRHFPNIYQIESASTREESAKLFCEIYDLQKVIINILITLSVQDIHAVRRDHKLNTRAEAKIFQDLKEDIFSLAKRSFFAIKQLTRHQHNNFSSPWFMDRDIKREFFINRISADLREAFRVSCNKPEDVNKLDILSSAGLSDFNIGGPTSEFVPGNSEMQKLIAAPALWSERPRGYRLTPADFLLDVYHPWLGHGLSRASLKQLDLPLYNALSKWLTRHSDDDRAQKIQRLLPDRSRRSEAELKNLGFNPNKIP